MPEIVEGDQEDIMPIQENVQQQYNMIVVNDFVIPSRN
jgi:hypothetical protein